MLTCAKITKNAALGSCRQGNAAVSGRVIAINWEDWTKATITEANSVISSIALDGSDKAYSLTSKDKGITASYSLNQGTYGNSLVHQIVIRSFDRTQDNKATVNKLIHGRYVFIVEHVDQESNDTVYEVYGRQNGLTASALTGDSSNTDGVIDELTLTSDESARESELPTSVFDTDLATTRTMIEALISA